MFAALSTIAIINLTINASREYILPKILYTLRISILTATLTCTSFVYKKFQNMQKTTKNVEISTKKNPKIVIIEKFIDKPVINNDKTFKAWLYNPNTLKAIGSSTLALLSYLIYKWKPLMTSN